MADWRIAEKSTGYVLGGISPLGQKKSLPTVIEDSAESLPSCYVSAGRRGLAVAPADLRRFTGGRFAPLFDIAQT